jgi:phage regulator Rha-like protein
MLPELHTPDIVLERNGEPVTTSLAISEGTQIEHKAVIQLIRKYLDDLEEFGPLTFEMRVVKRPQGGGSQSEIAFLNEPQSTLLLTYMRNSDIVRAFKKALVRAFFELRDVVEGKVAPTNMPASVSHRADHIVSATRSFNGLLRTAQALRLGHARAAHSANEATLRNTGFNLLQELGVSEEDLAAGEPSTRQKLAAPASEDTLVKVSIWLNAPEQAGQDSFTTADILMGALSVAPDHRYYRSLQTTVGYVMQRLGFRRQRGHKNSRQWRYIRPEG